MKKAYRMFQRTGRQNYYIQNNATREQRCLDTSDRNEAQRLLDAANQARQMPALNLQLGTVYISHAEAIQSFLESSGRGELSNSLCRFQGRLEQLFPFSQNHSLPMSLLRPRPYGGHHKSKPNEVGSQITSFHLAVFNRRNQVQKFTRLRPLK
jgi:hypothetical protein